MINAIFAVDEAGALGYKNGLPWGNNKTDLARFKEITHKKIVMMGRNTWDSLPDFFKPLTNRFNVIVTSHKFKPFNEPHPLVSLIHPDFLISYLVANKWKPIYIIGGKQLIESTIHMIDHIHLTEISGTYPADTHLNMVHILQNLN